MPEGSSEIDGSKRARLVLSVTILAAYVRYNAVPVGDMPRLIFDIYGIIDSRRLESVYVETLPVPAVDPTKSVTDGYIICLEDGEKHAMLTRHLRAKHDLSPVTYRKKWDLPPEYPMNSRNYIEKRSRIAKAMGLGGKAKGFNVRW